MVKIIVPKLRAVRRIVIVEDGNEEKNVEKGDLALLVLSRGLTKDGEIRSGTMGVVEELINQRLTLSNLCYIFKGQTLGGISIPFITKTPYGRNSYTLDRKVKQIYIGQEEIVEVLGKIEGFKGHAELISRMTKPYSR